MWLGLLRAGCRGCVIGRPSCEGFEMLVWLLGETCVDLQKHRAGLKEIHGLGDSSENI